jgi:hypothetical protein
MDRFARLKQWRHAADALAAALKVTATPLGRQGGPNATFPVGTATFTDRRGGDGTERNGAHGGCHSSFRRRDRDLYARRSLPIGRTCRSMSRPVARARIRRGPNHGAAALYRLNAIQRKNTGEH